MLENNNFPPYLSFLPYVRVPASQEELSASGEKLLPARRENFPSPAHRFVFRAGVWQSKKGLCGGLGGGQISRLASRTAAGGGLPKKSPLSQSSEKERPPLPYVGTEKIVGRRGPKIVTGWGKNMASGRGTASWDREEVGRGYFQKNDKK